MTGISVLQEDITIIKADAIVNAANTSLLGGGGVDGAIHRAAGPQLLEACRALHGCKTGEAKITGGYKLPAKYVIHTAGPVWHGGKRDEPAMLAAAYRNSLQLAADNNCRTIAFPNISTGIYGYPRQQAAAIAVATVRDFIASHTDVFDEVIFVCFDKENYNIYVELQNNAE